MWHAALPARLAGSLLVRKAITMYRSLLHLSLVLLFASCGSANDVVREGPFQKRKYVNKGWFLDAPVKQATHLAIIEELPQVPGDLYLEPLMFQMPELVQMEESPLEQLKLRKVVKEQAMAEQESANFDHKVSFGPRYFTGALNASYLSEWGDRPASSVLTLMSSGLTTMASAGVFMLLLFMIGRSRMRYLGTAMVHLAILAGAAGLLALAMI